MGDISRYKNVGFVDKKMASVKGFNHSGYVYAAPGVFKHIQKHQNEFNSSISSDIEAAMKSILASPDYIGCDPKKAGESLELVKKIGDNVLLALEVDKVDNYIYVSSMYVISDAKLSNRVYSNRVIKI